MEFFLVLVIALVGGGVLFWRRSQAGASRPKQQTEPKPRSVDPLANWSSAGGDQQFYDLKPGALIKTQDHDYLVRGTITFTDGSYRWHEHLLEDSGHKCWLSVEDDEGLELAFWERIPLADIEGGEPGAKSVVVRGVAYKFVEKGKAPFVATGTTGVGDAGVGEYIDYEAADGRMLSFERYDDGAWEMALGVSVQASSLDVYPAGV